jgi:predicted ester cyclase
MQKMRGSIGLIADVAQLVEHVLGKNEVSGSIPDVGSSGKKVRFSLG